MSTIVVAHAFSFLLISLIIFLISIISAGIESIFFWSSSTELPKIRISSFIFSHFCVCSFVLFSLKIVSFSASKISSTKDVPSFLLRAPLKSVASSFANLYFISNTSKSRNLARISFLFVDPSLINCNAPNWEDIDVKRKSSKDPKWLRIILSVSFLVVPFNSWIAPVAKSLTEKFTLVLASKVSSPLSFLTYFSLSLSIQYSLVPTTI